MTLVEEWEEEAGENAQRVITLVEACRKDELTEFVRTLDPGETILVMYALAAGLLRQEHANDQMLERHRMLAVGMTSLLVDRDNLSAERARLTDDLASVREDRENQAVVNGKYREALQGAGLLLR